jgi:putative spermidine/putrescine transport system permease protein
MICFNLYGFWLKLGLCFSTAAIGLIIAPALMAQTGGREASENLGATTWQYWRYVALPILLPSLLGSFILLFGNSLGLCRQQPGQNEHKLGYNLIGVIGEDVAE